MQALCTAECGALTAIRCACQWLTDQEANAIVLFWRHSYRTVLGTSIVKARTGGLEVEAWLLKMEKTMQRRTKKTFCCMKNFIEHEKSAAQNEELHTSEWILPEMYKPFAVLNKTHCNK